MYIAAMVCQFSAVRGFGMKSLIPALKQRNRLSADWFAVTAMMGVLQWWAIWRIRLVASIPDNVGRKQSIKITVYLPGTHRSWERCGDEMKRPYPYCPSALCYGTAMVK